VNLPDQPKITDLGDESLGISENIVRLEISMKEAIRLNVLQSNR
jgi:hypothetical protein